MDPNDHPAVRTGQNMDPNDYQRKSLRTEKTPEFVSVSGSRPKEESTAERLTARRISRLLHAVLGLASETGELADQLKKHIMYGKALDEKNVVEELGDLAWYAALGADAVRAPLGEVLEKNVAKLAARYPEGFTPEKALNRDLEKERAALGYAAPPEDHDEAYSKHVRDMRATPAQAAAVGLGVLEVRENEAREARALFGAMLNRTTEERDRLLREVATLSARLEQMTEDYRECDEARLRALHDKRIAALEMAGHVHEFVRVSERSIYECACGAKEYRATPPQPSREQAAVGLGALAPHAGDVHAARERELTVLLDEMRVRALRAENSLAVMEADVETDETRHVTLRLLDEMRIKLSRAIAQRDSERDWAASEENEACARLVEGVGLAHVAAAIRHRRAPAQPPPRENQVDRVAEETEACAQLVEGGSFLHGESGEARFGKAAAATIRRRLPYAPKRTLEDMRKGAAPVTPEEAKAIYEEWKRKFPEIAAYAAGLPKDAEATVLADVRTRADADAETERLAARAVVGALTNPAIGDAVVKEVNAVAAFAVDERVLAWRCELAEGKYTKWAANLTSDQLFGLLHAVGEFGVREPGMSEPQIVLGDHPRALAARQVIRAFVRGKPLSAAAVTHEIRRFGSPFDHADDSEHVHRFEYISGVCACGAKESAHVHRFEHDPHSSHKMGVCVCGAVGGL